MFSITGNRMDMHWTFTFAPEDTGTELRATAELEPKGAMRLASALLGPMMRCTFAKRPAQLAAGVAARRSREPQVSSCFALRTSRLVRTRWESLG